MYEQHFGLSKRPFAHQAAGDDVFIGPQTATLVKRAQRAFEEQDSVICVSGPVGCGKSTVVARTLSALGWPHTVVHIGRIKLGTDETIEFLLRELGLKQMPTGTIRKLAVFRSLLDNLHQKGIRLFIVVEDAARLGNEALAELEALTASDSGVSVGAGLVLMAEESLKRALNEPGLARLSQRARLHYEIRPLSTAELRGYVAHGLRQAGGEIDDLFDEGSLETLYALSGGVPRIVNNLIGSVFARASESGVMRVDKDMLIGVAADEYGIETGAIDVAHAVPAANMKPDEHAADAIGDSHDEAVPETAAEPKPETAWEPAPEAVVETAPQPEAAPASEPEALVAPEPVAAPVPDAAAEPAPESEDRLTPAAADDAPQDLIQDTAPGLATLDSGEFAIPELIQDTLPDLEVLAPELAPGADAEREIDAEPANVAAAEPADGDSPANDIPTLVAEPPDPEAEAQPAASETAQQDPTVAELKPDLEALEQAMAAAQGSTGDDESLPVLTPTSETSFEPAEQPSDVPEITLDDSIRRKIDLAEAEASVEQAEVAEETADAADDAEPRTAAAGENDSEPASADGAELERIAAQLANVKSLEDVDDAMAETLFGAEISMIAAQVVANPAAPEHEEQPLPSEPVELSLVETSAGMEAPANDMEQEFRELYGDKSEEVSIETESNGGMDLSASQRLATVRALNAGNEPAAKAEPPRGKTEPQPIEDQINTSITQTLKALNVEDIEEVEDESPRKNGFFSRFRKP